MPRQIVMDPSGHSTFEFNASDTFALAEAERRFQKLVGKGYIPAEHFGNGVHSVRESGHRQFNPDAEETIFIPALRGG